MKNIHTNIKSLDRSALFGFLLAFLLFLGLLYFLTSGGIPAWDNQTLSTLSAYVPANAAEILAGTGMNLDAAPPRVEVVLVPKSSWWLLAPLFLSPTLFLLRPGAAFIVVPSILAASYLFAGHAPTDTAVIVDATNQLLAVREAISFNLQQQAALAAQASFLPLGKDFLAFLSMPAGLLLVGVPMVFSPPYGVFLWWATLTLRACAPPCASTLALLQRELALLLEKEAVLLDIVEKAALAHEPALFLAAPTWAFSLLAVFLLVLALRGFRRQ